MPKSHQPRIKTIPPAKHDNYALLWDLADWMAERSGKPEWCWLELMDAFWAGELPKLFCFTRHIKGSDVPGRSLLALPSRQFMAEHLLGHKRDIDAAALAELRNWTLKDYEKYEPFRFYVTRDPRFGLAVRCADFERWDRRVRDSEFLRYPKRTGGAKPTKREAVRAFIKGQYGGNIPANVTMKIIAQAVGVNERTVRRALGRK